MKLWPETLAKSMESLMRAGDELIVPFIHLFLSQACISSLDWILGDDFEKDMCNIRMEAC